MPYHYFTIGGCRVDGFKVAPDGSVADFSGTLRNSYKSIARASSAARRKYGDTTITVTNIEPQKKRYRVSLAMLLDIAEEI